MRKWRLEVQHSVVRERVEMREDKEKKLTDEENVKHGLHQKEGVGEETGRKQVSTAPGPFLRGEGAS